MRPATDFVDQRIAQCRRKSATAAMDTVTSLKFPVSQPADIGRNRPIAGQLSKGFTVLHGNHLNTRWLYKFLKLQGTPGEHRKGVEVHRDYELWFKEFARVRGL